MSQVQVARLHVQSPWRLGAVEFSRSYTAMFGLLVLLVIMLMAALAPWIVFQNPYDLMQLNVLDARLPPLIVIGALQIARGITLEATLSFLGLGVPITEPSLGLLIANGFQYMLSNEYWISFFPGLALLITIVAINLVGDRLRDVLNPRLQR